MRHPIALLLALMIAAPLAPAAADQNDPRLPALFARLRAAGDAQQAAALGREIWRIWFRSGRPDIDAALASAETLMRSRRFAEAEAVYDDIVRRAPGFAEGWNRRATVRYLRGEHAGSLADIARTLRLEPHHFGALSGRGLVLVKLGRDREALKAFEAALAVHPHLTAAEINIRLLRDRLGEKAI